MQGEIIIPAPNHTYDLLTKPVQPGAQATMPEIATYTAVKTIWNKKNTQVLGLTQATIFPVIWQNYVQYGVAKDLWDAPETKFGKAVMSLLIRYS